MVVTSYIVIILESIINSYILDVMFYNISIKKLF